jgi:beta-glucosidase
MKIVLKTVHLLALLLLWSAESKEETKFLWGTATAAYQIEGGVRDGGRGPSVWDSFSKIPGKISRNQNGDVADDSYHLFRKDIALLKFLGVNSYRFSISWSRIQPLGYGEVNQAGISYYNNMINLLVANNIEPLVTLYHWDLPQGLEDQYEGLLNPQFEGFFVDYAKICFEAFGDRVKKWITVNEPWTVSFHAYVTGMFAPGRCSDRSRCQKGDSSTEGYIVAHNFLNAHAAVVELYRKEYQASQGGMIGITVNCDWAEPLREGNEADIAAAERRAEFQLGWFTDPIYLGDYPSSMKQLIGERLPSFTKEQRDRLKGSIDFLGLNHYSTKYYFSRDKSHRLVSPEKNGIVFWTNVTAAEESMRYGGWADDQLNFETKYDVEGNLIGPQAQSPWLNVVPWGFYKVIMWTHNRYKSSDYKKVPIFITENGCDAPGETELPLKKALRDNFRLVIPVFTKFFRDYAF